MNITTAQQFKNDKNKYHYKRPLIQHLSNDMFISQKEPKPGSKIQPFDLQTTDGGHVRSADIKSNGQHILLVTGSLTCPITESGADGIKQLYSKYGDQVRFVMLQVREAHPGEDIPQLQTYEQKLERGLLLKKHHNLQFEVAIDDMDGTLHSSLDLRPNSAYLIDSSGTIVFHAQWANETQAIAEGLQAVIEDKKPPTQRISRTLHAMLYAVGYGDDVLRSAGRGAHRDTWILFPPLGLAIFFSKLFFFLPRHQRGLPAMLFIAGLTIVMLAVVFNFISRFIF